MSENSIYGIRFKFVSSNCAQVVSLPSSGKFNAESFSVLAHGRCNRRITSLAVSNDVQSIAAGCSDGSISVADVHHEPASYKYVRRHDGSSLGCSR